MDNVNENNIIEDVLKRTADTTEISDVVKWFATEEGQEFLSDDIDESIESLLQGSESEGMFVGEIPSDKILNRINRQIRFRRFCHAGLRVAAVVFPLVLLAGIAWFYSGRTYDNVYTELYVPKGGQTEVTLEEGSRIYLGSDTYFRYPKSFASGERRVCMEGEGYFMVEKDSERPFVIETDGAEVRVLGTSFNMEAYPESRQITLQLDEGSIRFISSSTRKEYVMEPGEKLVYDREKRDWTVSQAENDSMRRSWENKTFSFDNASLRQVTETLEHWYDIRFYTEDEGVWKYSYTFEADRSSLERILSDMEKVSPVSFKSEGNMIKISIK